MIVLQNTRSEKMSSTRYTVFPTEWGWSGILHHGEILSRLAFGLSSPEMAEKTILHGKEGEIAAKASREPPGCVRLLQDYFAGKQLDFSAIETEKSVVSPFRRAVYRACRTIPPAEVRSYGELAEMAGVGGAARAVGSAMAANPLPIVVPCHRVVRKDGTLGHYSGPGGVRTKRRLLQHERRFFADRNPP
jgi:methylated-DNA-[protein]-cysteine S-methyltransferase